MLSHDASIIAMRETVFSDLGDEVAILNLRSGEYFGLNPVGAFVWSLIQERQTFGRLCSAVVGEYDVTPEQCAADLDRLFREMVREDLIIVEEPA